MNRQSPVSCEKLHTIGIALLSSGNVRSSYGEEPVLEHDGPRPNDCVLPAASSNCTASVVANCELRCIDREAEARVQRIGKLTTQPLCRGGSGHKSRHRPSDCLREHLLRRRRHCSSAHPLPLATPFQRRADVRGLERRGRHLIAVSPYGQRAGHRLTPPNRF